MCKVFFLSFYNKILQFIHMFKYRKIILYYIIIIIVIILYYAFSTNICNF